MSVVRGGFLHGEAFRINLLSVIWSNEVSVVEGSECTEVYGETNGTQKIVRYIAGVRR